MMKGLVISGDYWHPYAIVEEGLQFLHGHGWDLTFLREMEHIDLLTYDFTDYEAIFVCKDNRNSYENAGQWLTEAVAERFSDYVETGGCLLVMHAGSVAPKSSTLFKELVGCEFDMHPEQCPVKYFPAGNTSLIDGVNEFTEKDEHYKIDILVNDINVFLSSTSEYFDEIAGYSRNVGSGKVIVLTPGHNLPVWLHPEYQKLIVNILVEYAN